MHHLRSLLAAIALSMLVLAHPAATVAASSLTPPPKLAVPTYYVRISGNDKNDGTSVKNALRTIDAALHKATAGGDIVVGPGIYSENAALDETNTNNLTVAALTLEGDESGRLSHDSPGTVVIQAHDPALPALKFARVSDLRITGLAIKGPGQGIAVAGASHISINACTFDSLLKGLAAANTTD